jgi:hypothetical protein
VSARDDGKPPRVPGRRKDGLPYKDGNTREDGSFAIGRNRPPPEHRYKKGDGRKRGRRSKGVPNLDTEFEKELNRKITIREDGKSRKITKNKGVDLRLIDNGLKGDNRAIEMIDARRRRIADNREAAGRYHTLADQEILETYLRERATELNISPGLFGDPAPEPSGEDSDD